MRGSLLAVIAFGGIIGSPSVSNAQHPWSLRLFWENDSRPVVPHGTDDSYTQGARIELSRGDGTPPWWRILVPPRLQRGFLWRGDRIAPGATPDDYFYPSTAWVIGQNMYTPRDLLQYEPIYNDRPYAGWAYVGVVMRAHTERQLHSLEIDLGTTGPNAHAGDLQAWFHEHVSHGKPPHGWSNQLPGGFAYELSYQSRHRYFLHNASCNGWCIDAIPAWGIAIGNVQDFGSSRIWVQPIHGLSRQK